MRFTLRRRGVIGILAPCGLFAGCGSDHSAPPFELPDPPAAVCPAPTGVVVSAFHGNAGRSGWDSAEPELAPAAIAGGKFGLQWTSPELDSETIEGTTYAPHIYAAPLYMDGATISGGDYDGVVTSVVYVATNHDWVYALSAVATNCGGRDIPAGTILWKSRVGTPAIISKLDGDIPMGIMGTPVLDTTTSPPRLYVSAMEGRAVSRIFALDATSGAVLPGWPVTIDAPAIAAVLPGAQFAHAGALQRSALAMSPDGRRLYVTYAAGIGWMAVVDTHAATVVNAFAAGPIQAPEQGGMWGAGGPAIDAKGTVYMTTGNAPEANESQPGYWGESLLAWDGSNLDLTGTYTPFNYCDLETADADFGGDSPLVLPDLDPAQTSTPHLVASGSKQGDVYLLDRDHLPGSLVGRAACTTDATKDQSLLPPDAQPQFGTRGPLAVFGPYSEKYGNLDWAKMRSTPAFYQGDDGTPYLFVAGASKQAADSQVSVPPSIVRLRVALAPNAPAYLTVDGADQEMSFLNPGSPIVTSTAGHDAVVWVLDENAGRTAPLVGPNAPHPVLYAMDGKTMKLLWKTAPGELEVGGKYTTPTSAHGVVYVGTDRIRAYGIRP